MGKPRAAVSWSGGKDCCLALHRARARFDVVGLLSMLTTDGSRSRSHGLSPELLRAQARALGLPLLTARANWDNYESRFARLLESAKQWDISHVIFGDVFPDAHKQWAEAISQGAGLTAVEPLWNEPTTALAREFIAAGGEAMIVTVREKRLGPEWLGRVLTTAALDELASLGVDPGGENGEFHTLVTKFPGLDETLRFGTGETLAHGGCHLLNISAKDAGS